MQPRVGMPPEGEPDPSARALAQKLRELPPEVPPPFDWAELQRRARARAPRASPLRRVDLTRRTVLLAAGLASLVAAGVLLGRFLENGWEPARPAADAVTVARAPAPRSDFAPGDRRDAEPLLERAETAERWLASTPDSGPIVRVSTRLAVTDLEDRIASMDDLLNVERMRDARAGRVRALQLERAQLVDSLAQVRYAEMLAAELP
ncbi:MAG TPA: hypothetical protein VMD03_00980 [Steroidobacteraceae bacterium]|nr:hypothetical protein [Steroidobacteraceae bacterium]